MFIEKKTWCFDCKEGSMHRMEEILHQAPIARYTCNRCLAFKRIYLQEDSPILMTYHYRDGRVTSF